MHQPLGAQTESPRRHDGVTTSARGGARSAAHADSTNTDHRQQREDAHERGGKERVEVRVLRASEGRMDTTVGPGGGLGAPDMSDDSPRALTPPDKPAQRHSESPSVKPEEKRRFQSSVEVGPTSAEADASRPSSGDEDAREQPRKPRNASDLERERSERRDEENSPREPRDQLREPDDEVVVSSSPHSIQEGPQALMKQRGVDTNVPSQVIGQGGTLELQGESKVVEGDPDHTKAVKDTKCDWIGPSSIEGNWKCRKDGEGVGNAGRRGSKDGAMSSASHDLKQVRQG